MGPPYLPISWGGARGVNVYAYMAVPWSVWVWYDGWSTAPPPALKEANGGGGAQLRAGRRGSDWDGKRTRTDDFFTFQAQRMIWENNHEQRIQKQRDDEQDPSFAKKQHIRNHLPCQWT